MQGEKEEEAKTNDESRASVLHPERAPRRWPARGDERVAGVEQAGGGGERAVEDGAVDPVLEQALLAPHVRDAHPSRHLRPVPLQPLPRALLPRGAEASTSGGGGGGILRGSAVLLLLRLRCPRPRRPSGLVVVGLGRACLRLPLLGRLQVGDRRPRREAGRLGVRRRRRHAGSCCC
jgi:hypothetical protein